ncbi:calcium-binding protein [Rubellimicrobium roseum]|uniref:Calcium-binding protein n=1 Tax=Rubellimicrobium roseum TaxID=687525 RepID=A0A5C4NKZ0_9RHOB|nr:calcium-binding protein [Rubellimicrobium roseum]TNC73079.1 calcium-binding protein [Rubellimicrobium roseum]
MPTFQIYAAHASAIWAWDELADYDIVKLSPTRWRMRYDAAENGQLDSGVQATDIVVTLSGDRITKLEYRDDDGHRAAELRGLSFDASLFQLMVEENSGAGLYQRLARPGLTMIGGRQSNDQYETRDNLVTSQFADTVSAQSGNDTIYDLGGADRYVGGTGWDYLSYEPWLWRDPADARGIVADLRLGTVRGPDGRVDIVSAIEAIGGTFLADTLRGSGGDQGFWGGAGRDRIEGRDGFDMVEYLGRTGAGTRTTTNLAQGFAIDEFGSRDRLVGIEGAVGTEGRDTMIDDRRNNDFFGLSGRDRFVLSGGDDHAWGGGGADRFVFRTGTFGEDTIFDFNGRRGDRIEIEAAGGMADVEILQFDKGTHIHLDGGAMVVLAGYLGPVEPYLVF